MATINLEVLLGDEAQVVYYALQAYRERSIKDALEGAASDNFSIKDFLSHWDDVERVDGLMAFLFDQINYAAHKYEADSLTENNRAHREHHASDRRDKRLAYWSERFGLSDQQAEVEQNESAPQRLSNTSNPAPSDHDDNTRTD